MEPAQVPDYTKSDSCAGCAAVGICRPDKAPKAETNANVKPAAAAAKPAQVEQQKKETVGEVTAEAMKEGTLRQAQGTQATEKEKSEIIDEIKEEGTLSLSKGTQTEDNTTGKEADE